MTQRWLLLLLSFGTGCSSRPVRPELPAPDYERVLPMPWDSGVSPAPLPDDDPGVDDDEDPEEPAAGDGAHPVSGDAGTLPHDGGVG